MMYVTYKWRLPIWEGSGYSNPYAIEIENNDINFAWDCARDIYSIHGIVYVKVNKCGRLPKNTTIIKYEDYKNGKYYNM